MIHLILIALMMTACTSLPSIPQATFHMPTLEEREAARQRAVEYERKHPIGQLPPGDYRYVVFEDGKAVQGTFTIPAPCMETIK